MYPIILKPCLSTSRCFERADHRGYSVVNIYADRVDWYSENRLTKSQPIAEDDLDFVTLLTENGYVEVV